MRVKQYKQYNLLTFIALGVNASQQDKNKQILDVRSTWYECIVSRDKYKHIIHILQQKLQLLITELGAQSALWFLLLSFYRTRLTNN